MKQKAVYPDLENRVVLVTGGAAGIGAAMVRAFCEQGSQVAFFDIAMEDAKKLVTEINGTSRGRAHFLRCDLRDTNAMGTAIQKVSGELGKISVLVNNAGNDNRHKFADVSEKYWNERVELNLRHIFFSCQAVFPQMKELRQGSIVNMGSIIWRIKQEDAPVYSMCKAAIHGLTRALAGQFGAFGVRVNTISPGAVWTERQMRLWFTPEVEAKVMANQCLKTRILPEDVAELAMFLASDASSKCAAQEFIVDAGWS